MQPIKIFLSLVLLPFAGNAEDHSFCERPVLGQAVNLAHMANYSNYVNARLLKDKNKIEELVDNGREASNFRFRGNKYGHHFTIKSWRTKDWNKTNFTNFSLEAINFHSVQAKKVHWKNFYIAGNISNWNFREAVLENGWFNAQMKNCDFRNATLRNIGFYGAKLTRTNNLLKFGKSINFDGATLENVAFKGSALKRASFRNTVFRSNVRFENANVRFVSQLAGSTFIDDVGKKHLITNDHVNKMAKAMDHEVKNVTSEQIVESIKDHD